MDFDNKELILIQEWQYDVSNVKGVEIYFSREKPNIKVSLEDVKAVLEQIPKNHRKFIPKIYIVNYFCQDNPKVKGRHLAALNYVIIYPNTNQELKKVLLHEIGHVIWDKKLTPQERISFYYAMLKDVPVASEIDNELKRHVFVLENFANCYMFFLSNIFDAKKYPSLHQFILSLF